MGARRQLGLTAIGGLLTSQLITLYLTPVIYLYMDGLQQRMERAIGSIRHAWRTRQGRTVAVAARPSD
jgi:predicted exporter